MSDSIKPQIMSRGQLWAEQHWENYQHMIVFDGIERLQKGASHEDVEQLVQQRFEEYEPVNDSLPPASDEAQELAMWTCCRIIHIQFDLMDGDGCDFWEAEKRCPRILIDQMLDGALVPEHLRAAAKKIAKRFRP